MNAATTPFEQEARAALQWWRMAGVTDDFADDATDWLGSDTDIASGPVADDTGDDRTSRAARTSVVEPAKKPAPIERNLLGASPPQTIEEFRSFWLETSGLDAIGPRGRTAPRGPQGAELMVLVTDPEEGDTDTLLSGPQGQLLGNMLAAMGIARDRVYFASALPRHTPMADTPALAVGGMLAVNRHHIGLVSPQKLLVFGKSTLPLIGQNVSGSGTSLLEINQDRQSVPLLMSEGLESLLAMPRLKARFWRRWVEWAGTM
ncbi:hypothetical protein [Qipengyuania nanhaisediminis]|uniref:hypothetical protein n=1 Tax=Qipengyuania nanhaisediminis TaxID=604088 RepID=UPI0038B3B48D